MELFLNSLKREISTYTSADALSITMRAMNIQFGGRTILFPGDFAKWREERDLA